jgi:hypothetical protein
MTVDEARAILDSERPYGNGGGGFDDKEKEEAFQIAIQSIDRVKNLNRAIKVIKKEIENYIKDYGSHASAKTALWIIEKQISVIPLAEKIEREESGLNTRDMLERLEIER